MFSLKGPPASKVVRRGLGALVVAGLLGVSVAANAATPAPAPADGSRDLAAVDYTEVFTNPELVMSGNNGQAIVSGTTLKATWDLKVPAEGVEGDQLSIHVDPPFYFRGTISDLEIKDGLGTVFARANAADFLEGDGKRRASTMVFTLAEAVGSHSDIQGFVELDILWEYKTVVQEATLKITGGGKEIGPSGTFTIPKFGVYTDTVMFAGQTLDGQYAAVDAISVALGASINYDKYRFTITPESPGMEPTCTAWATPVLLPELGGALDSSGRLALDLVKCDPLTGVSEFKFPAGTTMDPDRHYAWRTVTSYLTDKTHTEYTARLQTIDPSIDRTLSAISGNPPEVGANAPSIEVAKTVSGPAAPAVGDRLTYTVSATARATNVRPVFNIALADVLPEGLKFISASGGGKHTGGSSAGGGQVKWPQIELMLPGDKATQTVEVEVVSSPPSESVKNVAKATGQNVCDGKDTISKCEATTTTKIVAPKFLFKKNGKVTDTNANGWLGDAGDTITYTFQIKNTGTTTIRTARLTDDLLGISNLECLTEPLAPSGTVGCAGTWKHIITEQEAKAGKVLNAATLTVPGADDQEDSVEIPTLHPAFTFEKHVEGVLDVDGKEKTKGDPTRGDTILYGFTVKNTGSAPINGVTVTDPLLGVNRQACLKGGVTLKPKETAVCVSAPAYKYVVTDADVARGEIHNVATGNVTGLPPREGETTTPVRPTPPALNLPVTGSVGDKALLLTGAAVSVLAGAALTKKKRKVEESREATR
mgnify:FL=1